MTNEEIRQKIQTLVDSGQGENVYIAIYMMVNHLFMSLKEALMTLQLVEYDRNYSNPNDFYASIRIANVWLEYEYIEGYVPYMGTASTASRMVSYFENETLKMIDGLAAFLPVDDEHTPEDVRAIVLADYHSLIPTVIDLLAENNL